MTAIGVCHLTIVSQDPNPFISTGNSWKSATDQKTTFFGEFTVALPVIGVATRPRDIESRFIIRPKVLWIGNRPIRYFLGLVCGAFGYHVPHRRHHRNPNLNKSVVFNLANPNLGYGD